MDKASKRRTRVYQSDSGAVDVQSTKDPKLAQHDQALQQLLKKNPPDFERAEKYCLESYDSLSSSHEESASSLTAMVQMDPSSPTLTSPSNNNGGSSSGRQRRKQLMSQEKKKENVTIQDLYNPLILLLAHLYFERHDQVQIDKIIGKKVEDKTDYQELALKLLIKHVNKIHPVQAMNLIPEDLPIDGLVSELLEKLLRTSVHESRQNMIHYNLAKVQYRNCKYIRVKGLSRRVTITEETKCPVCKTTFDAQTTPVVLPDLTIVHFKCMNQKAMHKHPMTGFDFSLFPERIEEQIDLESIIDPSPVLNY